MKKLVTVIAEKKGFRLVYVQDEDAQGIGAALKEKRSSNEYQSPATRSSDDDLNDCDIPSNTQLNQSIVHDQSKLNIFGINQNIAQKQGLGRQGNQKFGAKTHSEIVEMLGPDGWQILSSLDHDTIKWLERRYSDGTLSQNDLMTIKYESLKGNKAHQT